VTVEFIDSETTEKAASTSHAMAAPSAGEDDVLVANFVCDGSLPTITPPTDWVQIASPGTVNPGHWMGYYVLTGASSSTYTWGLSASRNATCTILALSGVDLSTPLDVAASSTESAAGQSSVTVTGITPVTNDNMLIAGFGGNSGATGSKFTVSGSWTELPEGDGSNTGKAQATYYLAQATAAATGDVTANFSGSARLTGVLAAFRPASTGPPTVSGTQARVSINENFNGSTTIGINNNFFVGGNFTTSNSQFTSVSLDGGTIAAGQASVRSAPGCKIDTDTGGGTTQAEIAISSSSYVVVRTYVRFQAGAYAPASNYAFLSAFGSSNNRAQIQLTTGGNIRIRNNFTQVDIASLTVSQGEWYRLEWELDYTNNIQSMLLFADVDLHNDPVGFTEQLYGTFNTGAVDAFKFGFIGNPDQTATMVFDNIGISYEGYPGPTYGTFNGPGVSCTDDQVSTT
jgi:hypothetical protein